VVDELTQKERRRCLAIVACQYRRLLTDKGYNWQSALKEISDQIWKGTQFIEGCEPEPVVVEG